jgi:hypothetical protein
MVDNSIELEEHGTIPESSPQPLASSTASTQLATILRHALETVIPFRMVAPWTAEAKRGEKTKAFSERSRRGWRTGDQEERKGVTMLSSGQLLLIVDPLQLYER